MKTAIVILSIVLLIGISYATDYETLIRENYIRSIKTEELLKLWREGLMSEYGFMLVNLEASYEKTMEVGSERDQYILCGELTLKACVLTREKDKKTVISVRQVCHLFIGGLPVAAKTTKIEPIKIIDGWEREKGNAGNNQDSWV
jgi:hypothetical protein